MVNYKTKKVGECKTVYYRNKKLSPIILGMINKIKEDHAVTDEQIAICLEKSAFEFVTILKQRIQKHVQSHQKTKLPLFRKRRDVKRLRRILLAKLEGTLADQSYRMIRSIGGLKEVLPSIDAIRDMRQEVNEELIKELGVSSDEKYFSCSVEIDKVLTLICRIHSSAFPDVPLPDDIELKFSLDGRPNNGTDEVLIGIIPMNLQFPPQSGFSTFPLSILQCTESEATQTATNTLRTLCQLKTFNFRPKDTVPIRSFNMKVKMASDFVSLWKSSGLVWCDTSELGFCPYCTKRSCDIQIESSARVELRTEIPGLNFPSRDFIFCCLHMGMRITERIVCGTILHLIPAEIDKIALEFKQFKYGSIRREKDITASINGNGVKEILVENLESDDTSLWNQLNSTSANTTGIERISSWAQQEKRDRIIVIWNCWSVIYRLISMQQDLTEYQIFLLNTAIFKMQEKWPITFKSFMTPYLHVLFDHTVDVVLRVGSIGRYSQQGFEYANRLHRTIENRATNHGGGLGDMYLTEQLMLNFYARYKLAVELDLMVELNSLLNRKIIAPKKRPRGQAKSPSAPKKAQTRRTIKSRRANRSTNKVRGRFGPKQQQKKTKNTTVPKNLSPDQKLSQGQITDNAEQELNNNDNTDLNLTEDNGEHPKLFDDLEFPMDNEEEYDDVNSTLFR